MRRSMKTRLTAFLALCLCACICLAFPVGARADVTLEKLLVAMPTTPIAYMPAGNISASSSTEGCSVQSLVWYDASGSQFSGTFGTQTYTVEIVVSLAAGYSLASDARVYLNNSAVDYTVSGSSVTLRREYAPQIWTPDIYKHPEAETVTEGGFASFAASGAYYEKINWRLYNPDATSYYTMEEAVEKVPGITTDADGGTRMNLYNIPLELNGWRIAAYFSNPGGGRESYGAVITVKADPAKATPTPAPTATPEPEPSQEPDDKPHRRTKIMSMSSLRNGALTRSATGTSAPAARRPTRPRMTCSGRWCARRRRISRARSAEHAASAAIPAAARSSTRARASSSPRACSNI